jgi:hypothetical protein
MESIDSKKDSEGIAMGEADCSSSTGYNHRPTNTTSLHTQNDYDNNKPKYDIYEENCINLSLLDPARFGWTAGGGIADLSTPHEVRVQCCCSFLRDGSCESMYTDHILYGSYILCVCLMYLLPLKSLF